MLKSGEIADRARVRRTERACAVALTIWGRVALSKHRGDLDDAALPVAGTRKPTRTEVLCPPALDPAADSGPNSAQWIVFLRMPRSAGRQVTKALARLYAPAARMEAGDRQLHGKQWQGGRRSGDGPGEAALSILRCFRADILTAATASCAFDAIRAAGLRQ